MLLSARCTPSRPSYSFGSLPANFTIIKSPHTTLPTAELSSVTVEVPVLVTSASFPLVNSSQSSSDLSKVLNLFFAVFLSDIFFEF